MKLTNLATALIFSLAVISCKKEDKPVVQQPTMSFALEGKSQVAHHVEAVFDTTSSGQIILQVDGVMNNFAQHMGLTLTFSDKGVQTGTFTTATFTLMTTTGQGGYSSKELKVNITNINNKYAEGTFSGILSDGDIDKQLTDGTFKVNIQ